MAPPPQSAPYVPSATPKFHNPCQKPAALARHIAPKVERATTTEQETIMKKERRWMKSVLAASTDVRVALPWARGARRRPEAMKSAPAQPQQRAVAAR